jgi:predicted unusual protein kinase regulating ubiquinone biosynthesis (AarF/ABC1/UbiB family)
MDRDRPPRPDHLVRSAPVPEGRARRFLHIGRAVGEMAASAAAQGLGQLARGQRPDLAQLMLSADNARRLAQRLSTMRGAVMKVGQLMSMDGHGVLPPHFAALLGGLRDQAHGMPATQLADVLEREYGADWHQRFRRFSFTPVAAASIGQVHRAETHDGQVLALKIQYPGVRQSIASDMANLGLLARTPGLVPPGLDVAALLARAGEQLARETDYRAEARAATAYRAQLGDDPVLTVPAVLEAHCTDHIIATEFAPGLPVDRLAQDGAPQAQRDHVAAALCRLAVHEFFYMRLVQTDPNFGNYLFDAASGRIALIDFGATEAVTPERVEQLRALGRALRNDDRALLTAASHAAGFTAAGDPPPQTQGVIAMMQMAGEPLRQAGAYDFGASDLFARGFAQGQAQFFGEGYARTPPPDLMVLQRKFVGTFMLCARLRARVDLGEVFAGVF